MGTVLNLINALLVLIPLAGAARVAYCLTAVNVDPDEEKTYRTRARNVVIFCIIAETVVGFLSGIVAYYK